MRLFIAEKPSLARAIATGLGNGRKSDGCIICGNDVVTWCLGHLLELAYPEDYNQEYARWKRSDLPIIPTEWKYKVKPKSAKQLREIGKLLKDATSVVNAGDPDREGQLLVDEVLEHFNYTGPVSRIWLASLDDKSVQHALANIKDNKPYEPLRDSARARMQADWLVGMNATRAMTLHGRTLGKSEVLSVGRVQTPTLALVVARDREIANFKPKDFFVLRATLKHNAGHFIATLKPSADQAGVDSEGRLVDATVSEQLASSVKGAAGTIVQATRESKSKNAPLPHCLSSLQKQASSKLGMSAQKVLDTAQSLYEKKLTTYPRTDCRYLPEEQFADAENILGALAKLPAFENLAGKADASLKSAAWNTGKITAHHAIVPTGEMPGSLSKEESAIYALIATAYCLQFHPPMRYEAQKITVSLQDTLWETKGRRILDAGWTAVMRDDEDEDDVQALPDCKQDDAVSCTEVETLKKKTTPPSRFTEGTLIEAMANIHRFVADADAKAQLKETKGIGTEATRAGIIETLKTRQFLMADKKNIVSTALGKQLIDLVPETLKDPVTTADWEAFLEDVAKGQLSLAEFILEQKRLLPQLLAPILGNGTPEYPCPDCGGALVRRKSKKDGSFYWACDNYPDCKTTLPDANGKPGTARPKPVLTEHKCEKCGKPLVLRTGAKGDFYACSGYPDCKQTYYVVVSGGAPDFERANRPKPQITEFKCKECGKPLYRRNGQKGEFFSCSGYPDCKKTYAVGNDGKPVFTPKGGKR